MIRDNCQTKHFGEFHVQYSIGLIHQVIGNLVLVYNLTKTYVDTDTLRLVIFTAAAFADFSTANR